MANLRRQRGYAWEKEIAERFNDALGWKALRLGGTTTTMPDIMAVNPDKSVIVAIEAKSGAGGYLYVPKEQIERCIKYINIFSNFGHQDAVLAFKFMGKQRLPKGGYEPRKRKEYFYHWRMEDDAYLDDINGSVACHYDGTLWNVPASSSGASEGIFLKDYPVPFRHA